MEASLNGASVWRYLLLEGERYVTLKRKRVIAYDQTRVGDVFLFELERLLMSGENPYEPTQTSGSTSEASGSDLSSGKAAYNVISDTVVGLNVRKSDNKFQAIFIAVSVLLFAGVGALLAVLNPKWQLPWYGGAMAGAFGGLLIGFFSSGIFLMFYRASRHLKGKHD